MSDMVDGCDEKMVWGLLRTEQKVGTSIFLMLPNEDDHFKTGKIFTMLLSRP
jgi:hypothetical protein